LLGAISIYTFESMTYDAGTTKVGWLFPIGTWVVVHNWELGLLFPIGNLGCSQLGWSFFLLWCFRGKRALWYCNLLEVVFMFPIISEEGWGGRGGERRGGVVGDPPNTHVQNKDLIHHPPIHVFCKLKKVFYLVPHF
jgi:hypothetical protein